MELSQWIAVYTAISQTAAAQKRSRWILFAGGLFASSTVLLCLVYLTAISTSNLGRTFGIIGACFGLLVGMAWLSNQGRIRGECRHWESVLRSLESHFAGAELHRGLLRIMNGEEVCVAGSRLMGGEWHSDSIRLPWVSRILPNLLTTWLPVAFCLLFAAFLVWFALGGGGGAAGVSL